MRQIAQKEGYNFDAFLLNDYNFKFTQEFQDSLQQTEKLICILDQDNNSLYRKYLNAKLMETGLFETQVHLVTPHVSNIQSSQADALYEEAEFDIHGIYSQVIAYA